jgi:hypothetical protein
VHHDHHTARLTAGIRQPAGCARGRRQHLAALVHRDVVVLVAARRPRRRRFYLGKVGTGILKLLTIGGFGIWWLVDLVLTLTNAQKDKDGRRVMGTRQEQMIAWIVTAIGVLFGWVMGAVTQGFAILVEQVLPAMPWWPAG